MSRHLDMPKNFAKRIHRAPWVWDDVNPDNFSVSGKVDGVQVIHLRIN